MKSEMKGLTRRLDRVRNHHAAAQEIEKLKIKLTCQEKKSAEKNKEMEELKKEIRALKGEVKELKDVNDYLISLEDGDENETDECVHGKMYDTNMRKASYRAILAQCPVAQVENLLQTVVGILTKLTAVKTPSKFTAARMTHELSVLSSIQTVECLLQASAGAIGTDRYPTHSQKRHTVYRVDLRIAILCRAVGSVLVSQWHVRTVDFKLILCVKIS